MSFGRKPYEKPPRAPLVRSSLTPSSPAVMRPVGQAAARVVPEVPKRPAGKQQPTAAEREHMGRVAALGCLLCGQPAEVHHIREGQGMAQRASNWLTVPLCPEHHRGNEGLHGLGERGFERRYRLGELDLLAQTFAAISKGSA